MNNTLKLLALTAAMATSAQGAVLYHYAFETADATVNSGTGTATATAQGSVSSGAGVGSSGFFAAFDGGNVANSDALNVDVSVSGIAMNNFEVSFNVNQVAHTNYDDYMSFQTSAGANYAFETFPTGFLHLINPGTGGTAANIASGVDTSDGTWRSVRLVGSAGINALDATFELFIDGASVGTSQLAGGASHTMTNVRVGGRIGEDVRYAAAGIDEFIIATPEPSSVALLGLGGMAFILRRRK